eukprot:scaffold164411_cov44-Tisochrysis_lutea.AAC.2
MREQNVTQQTASKARLALRDAALNRYPFLACVAARSAFSSICKRAMEGDVRRRRSTHMAVWHGPCAPPAAVSYWPQLPVWRVRTALDHWPPSHAASLPSPSRPEQRRGGIDALDCEQRAPVVNGQPDGMDAVLEPLVRVEEPAHALHPLTEEGEGPREGERAAEREREREKEEGWPGCRSGDER